MPSGKGYTITYDGVASTTIPEFICEGVSRKMFGEVTDVWKAVPGKAGAWYFDNAPGMREITIHAAVLADTFPTGRRTAVEKVADWVDKDLPKKLAISDNPGRYNMAKLSVVPDPEEWRQLGRFDMTFLAEPYAYDDAISSQTITSTLPTDTDTFTMPDKVDGYPNVEVTANGGNISGFTLNVNGFVLAYGANLASGSKLTISSLSFTVVTGGDTDTNLDGVFNPALISMATVSGDFPILVKDSVNQSVIFTRTGGTATSATLAFRWRRRYRS